MSSYRKTVSFGYGTLEASQSPKSCMVLKQPETMGEDGDMAANWREWKKTFDYYMIASGKENATSREKCALFLHIIGKGGREIFEELYLDNETENDYEKLVYKFELYYDPACSVNNQRHEFFNTFQNEDSFDVFLEVLKKKSKLCVFGRLRRELIVTQIIRGLKDSDVREQLLRKPNLDLEEAMARCKVAEIANQQAGGTTHQPENISHKAEDANQETKIAEVSPGSQRHSSQHLRRVARVKTCLCDYCGSKHGVGDKCLAWDAICYNCERLGHFARMCRSRCTRI